MVWDVIGAALVNGLSEGGGGTDAASAGAAKYDAYKGDGPQGIGRFLTGIANAYKDLDITTDLTETRLKPQYEAKLVDILNHACADFESGEYHKAAAIADARAARDSAYLDYADKELPKIYARTCRSGLYDSTTAQMLANDAYSRTVVQAAKLELDTIQSYKGLHTQELQVLPQIFDRLIAGYRKLDQTEKQEHDVNIGRFSEDAAAFALFMTVLQLFSKRCYYADSECTGDSAGGVGGLIGNILP